MSAVLLERLNGSNHPSPANRRLTHCRECGKLARESEDVCERCGGDAPVPVSRIGEIYSYTIVHEGTDSFVLGLIQLSGGPLITARVDATDHNLRIGLPVELVAPTNSEAGSNHMCFSPLGAGCVTPG